MQQKIKASQTYLKGKSVFMVSMLVITLTILIVYITGENYHRTITSNLYLSLSIIGGVLFVFMAYGLYKGIGLTDDFPTFRTFKKEGIADNLIQSVDAPSIDVGEGLGGLVLSIVLWIVMGVLMVVLMLVLEAFLWISIFAILFMLYWIFFRALKMVFSKSAATKGKLLLAGMYSLGYTVLYLGWIFGIVYLTQVF
ncbi:hypothetical protein ACJD0Z_14005 [Flavobacteriaceae bacterium M23B6Z8]